MDRGHQYNALVKGKQIDWPPRLPKGVKRGIIKYLLETASWIETKDLAKPLHQHHRHPPLVWRTALLLVAMFTVVIGVPSVTQAFTEPNALSYPTVYQSGEVPQFLNASLIGQVKTGGLTIGDRTGLVSSCDGATTTGCSRFCLNPITANDTSDLLTGSNTDGHCIIAWQDLRNLTAGSFLHRFASSLQAGLADRGYTYVQGNIGNTQLYSLIVEPNSGTGGGALRAEGQTDTNYAAQFSGTLFIGNGPATSKLCLNDLTFDGSPGTGSCISHWSDIVTNAGAHIISLQDLQAKSIHVPDQGSARSTGPARSGSIVIGLPPAAGPVGVAKPYCGDSLCSHDLNEDVSTSPNYCAWDCP